MRLCRKSLIVLLMLFGAWSTAAGFQTTRHPAFEPIAKPAQSSVVTQSVPRNPAISRLRNGGAHASTRVRFPKRPTAHPNIRSHDFSFRGNAGVITSQHTSLGPSGGSIILSLDLGTPQIITSDLPVKNAPPGTTYSQVVWPRLGCNMPNGLTLLPSEGGGPDVPILCLTFAVPANAANIVPILRSQQTLSLNSSRLVPSEREVGGALVREYDASLYSHFPKVAITQAETFRSLRMVTVRVPLVGNDGHAVLRSFAVGVRFSLNAEPVVGILKDPLFSPLYSRLVANAYDVGRFAVPLRAGNSVARSGKGMRTLSDSLAFDSVYSWIDPSAPYLRLAVTRDGLYRVTANQLNFPALGFTLASSGWKADSIRCFNHGKEIPIWVDTDAAGNIATIEFYGQRLRGFPLPTINNIEFPERQLPEYYNVATDTNVYWLTETSKAAGRPLRFREIAESIPTALVLSSGTVMLHHERDQNYYTGDDRTDATVTIHMTPYVGGERFYWDALHGLLDPGIQSDTSLSHFTDTFYIAGLPADTAGKLATVRFLLRGISADNQAVQYHVVDAQINNGPPSSEDLFQDYNYDSLKLTIPLAQLHVGANVVRVNALTYHIAGVDQFYLDYYEVKLESGLMPSNDTAIAKGQWLFSESPQSRVFQLALSDSAAIVYNLSDGTRLRFHDGTFFDSTVSASPVYAAATDNSFLLCNNIQPWNTSVTRGWNILANANQADYIVITHPLFVHAAQELAANRSGKGLKSEVWTTDEIFNAFDYGSGEPIAIRRFLNYAYANYSGTPVSFVTLLGDASWDPKFNLPQSTHRSFVPTYGWPVSDYYFTLPGTSDSGLSVAPLMMIARIPGSSEAAVESYISKLVEYETEPPASWNRNFLFLSGGDSLNGQHLSFDAAIQSWIGAATADLGLILPPTNIRPTIVERTDFTSGVDATHVGQIEDALLRGQSIMYFGGHGATFTSDIQFPDASILNNKGLYPLLMTLTCQTGAFAEPNLISVNESYIDASEAGSVQAYGTTGFGEEDYDNNLTTYFFQHVRSFDSTSDTTRPQAMNMLSLLTFAKVFADQFGYSGGLNAGYNATIQNSMLGDAATGFVFRPQAEFAVYPNEINAYPAGDTIARTSLSISDSVMDIRARIHNYGYSADRPLVIRITDAGPNGLPFSVFDTLPRIDTSALVSAAFALNEGSIGEHTISVQIDPDSTFPESYRPDDFAEIQVRVNGLSTTPFYPYEGSRDFCDVGTGNVHFVILTPAGTSAGDQVELELDTSQRFSDILTDQTKAIGTSYYATFDIPIPSGVVPSTSVYWWRSRIHRANGDTTDWQYATFSAGSATRPEFSYTSPEQLYSTNVSGLALDSRGFLYLPAHDTEIISVLAHGQNDLGVGAQAYSQVSINGNHVYEDGREGVVIIIFTPDGSQIESSDEFDMDWPTFLGNPLPQDSAARIFDSVIDAIPANRRVIVMTVGQMDFQNFLDSTRSAMQTLGSANGMTPPNTGSYALIGTKGSSPGSAKEGNAANGTNGTMLSDTIITFGTSGLAETPFTAVARDYGSLTWTGDPVPAGSDIVFSILGERRDGGGIAVVDTFSASKGQSFDLSNINPRVYDRLGVQMNFVRTSNGTQSPALSGIALQYDAAPELLFTMDSIQTSPSLTNAGSPVLAKYGIMALTCTEADSIPVLLTRQYQGRSDTVASHKLVSLAGRSTQLFSDSIQTANELGTVALTATINPGDTMNEQLLFNDNIAGAYTVTRDTTKPTIQILFDGRNIPNGGYVSSSTTIQINLLSSNPLRDTAHSSILAASLIYLSGNTSENFQIGYYNFPQGFQQPEFGTFPTGVVQAYLRFKSIAPYSPGQWLLKAVVTDASGNTDTLEEEFTISNVNGLEHVMNYPNPFKDKTDFTFVLRNDDPVDVKIIVYTIAGRKIRTLTPLDTHAGFNAVEWDGRDERGNEVADGTYLYRVIINGKDGDNVSDAATESAVRSR